MSNHYAAHPKLILYVNYTSTKIFKTQQMKEVRFHLTMQKDPELTSHETTNPQLNTIIPSERDPKTRWDNLHKEE